jgi:hypothetical protein
VRRNYVDKRADAGIPQNLSLLLVVRSCNLNVTMHLFFLKKNPPLGAEDYIYSKVLLIYRRN